MLNHDPSVHRLPPSWGRSWCCLQSLSARGKGSKGLCGGLDGAEARAERQVYVNIMTSDEGFVANHNDTGVEKVPTAGGKQIAKVYV